MLDIVKIKKYIKDNNIKKKDLMADGEISYFTIQKILSGVDCSSLTLKSLEMFARALGVPPSFLFNFGEDVQKTVEAQMVKDKNTSENMKVLAEGLRAKDEQLMRKDEQLMRKDEQLSCLIKQNNDLMKLNRTYQVMIDNLTDKLVVKIK